MSPLSSIPGIGKTSLELLEVAGFLDVEALAQAGVDELLADLTKANSILHIAKRVPKKAQIEKWIHSARESLGQQADAPEAPVMPVNYEGLPDVMAMIRSAPVALPFAARHFVEHGLAVADIPPAIFLNRCFGDLEIRVEETIPQVKETEGITLRPRIREKKTHNEVIKRLGIDVGRLRSTAEFPADVRQPAMVTAEAPDRLTLLRAPLETTNRGKDPGSRHFIRGILHTKPLAVWIAALVTLLVSIELPLAIASALLLMMSDLQPANFYWVPRWLLVFPFALPVLGLAYLIFNHSGDCMVCRQRLFWPRNCIKNSKAHHIPGLGYIFPLCLHILLFLWYRCMYCGTPVRLKK